MPGWEYAALLGKLDELNKIQATTYQVVVLPQQRGSVIL
jgi:hypothetical protein